MKNNGIFTGRHEMKSRQTGFTLIELMIVVAIVALLATLVIPSYQESVKSSKRADAKGVLMNAANAMERYFTANNTYDGAAVGSDGIPDQSPLTGTANYNISVATNDSSYTLTATAVNGMDGDGNFTLTSTGARTWGANSCWEKTC